MGARQVEFPSPFDGRGYEALATKFAKTITKDGIEDVYPGDVAQEWVERWRDNPKVLERELASGGS